MCIPVPSSTLMQMLNLNDMPLSLSLCEFPVCNFLRTSGESLSRRSLTSPLEQQSENHWSAWFSPLNINAPHSQHMLFMFILRWIHQMYSTYVYQQTLFDTPFELIFVALTLLTFACLHFFFFFLVTVLLIHVLLISFVILHFSPSFK